MASIALFCSIVSNILLIEINLPSPCGSRWERQFCMFSAFHKGFHYWKVSIFVLLIQVFIEKQKGEILGVVIVESGWGSILPTVIIANMMHGGPAEKSGKLNIGDQIMSINGTSLVGLPLSTCQSIIKVQKLHLIENRFLINVFQQVKDG